jgi:hypothetical protein
MDELLAGFVKLGEWGLYLQLQVAYVELDVVMHFRNFLYLGPPIKHLYNIRKTITFPISFTISLKNR